MPEETTVFTVKLPGPLAARVRAHARESGRTISARWPKRWRSSWPAAREASAQVNDRAVRDGARLRPSRGHGNVGGLRHIGAAAAGPASRAGGGRRAAVTSAAIYARVSSARQKKDETIGSQTAALREHAGRRRLDVPEEWVFEDEGHSGATLVRPALEALRDLAAQGCLDVVLVLLAGPAGPQVRLPGAADGGVRPRRDPGRVRQGPARRHAPRTSCWSSSRACSPSTRRPS